MPVFSYGATSRSWERAWIITAPEKKEKESMEVDGSWEDQIVVTIFGATNLSCERWASPPDPLLGDKGPDKPRDPVHTRHG